MLLSWQNFSFIWSWLRVVFNASAPKIGIK
jgi:hypothetical protein